MKVRLFATGNVATGVIALGNVATGVVAIGNLARGVIAIGNVAIGVVAAGNVGFGVLFGAGATIGCGLLTVAGVQAFFVIWGIDPMPDLGVWPTRLLPLVAWLVAANVMRGRRWGTRLPSGAVPLSEIEAGDPARGWVVVDALERRGDEWELRSSGHRARVEVDASQAEQTLTMLNHAQDVEVLGQLARVERGIESASGYRDRPESVQVLQLVDTRTVSFDLGEWRAGIQWWISRGQLAGIVLGVVALVIMAVLP